MSQKELGRQFFHLGFGAIYGTLFYFNWMTPYLSLALLGFAFAGSIFIKIHRTFADELILMLERDQDMRQFPLRGPIFFLIGATLSLFLFSREVALEALVILSLVDSIGTAYGMTLGRIKVPWNKKKHLEGPLIGATLSTLLGLLWMPWWIALIGSLVGAFLDTLNPQIGRFRLDDNLSIPLICGAAMQLCIILT